MKYELGDKVKISKCWKPAGFDEQVEKKGIKVIELEDYLRSDEMAGDTLEFEKNVKVSVVEEGLIVGVRQIKTKYRIWHLYQESVETDFGYTSEIDRIEQESAEYEKVYLVATNLNCIRKVSFEDIQFVGLGGE